MSTKHYEVLNVIEFTDEEKEFIRKTGKVPVPPHILEVMRNMLAIGMVELERPHGKNENEWYDPETGEAYPDQENVVGSKKPRKVRRKHLHVHDSHKPGPSPKQVVHYLWHDTTDLIAAFNIVKSSAIKEEGPKNE